MADQDIDMIGTHALQYGLEETGGDWCTGSGEVKVVLMTINIVYNVYMPVTSELEGIQAGWNKNEILFIITSGYWE